MNEMTLWTQCLAAFNDVLSEKQMKTWFHPLEVKQVSNTLRVVAPNKFVKDEIQNENEGPQRGCLFCVKSCKSASLHPSHVRFVSPGS